MTANCRAWRDRQVLRVLREFRDPAMSLEKEVVLAVLRDGEKGISRRIRLDAQRWLEHERRGLAIQREVAAHAPALAPAVLEERVDDGWWISTSRFIEARPVQACLLEEGYSLRGATLLACKLCAAVETLEHLGFLHNDLKPEHFLRRRDGTVALIDWGSSTRLAEAPRAVPRTPLYVPPEGPGPRIDQWGLAVTIFQLLAHELPYPEQPGGRPSFQGPLPIPGNWTKPMRVVFERALAIEPRHRFGSAAEMRQALSAAIGLGDRPTRVFAALLAGRRVWLVPVVTALLAVGFSFSMATGRPAKKAEARAAADDMARKKVAKKNPAPPLTKGKAK